MGGLKRAVTGESFSSPLYADGGPGLVGFGGNVPGKVMAIELRGGRQWILQKTAFLAAEAQVNLDIAFQRSSGGALRRRGLVLRKCRRRTVFISGSGDFIE